MRHNKKDNLISKTVYASPDVPPGWTPDGWSEHLRTLANYCRAINPEAADTYVNWAAAIDLNHAKEEGGE